MKKVVKNALKKAKELEKKTLISEKDIAKIQKETEKEAEKLKKTLKPAWYLGKKQQKAKPKK